MTLSKVDQNELPEYLVPFSVVYMATVAGATGQVVLVAPGHHPKCRLVKAVITSEAYSTAADVYAIEDGDGNDAATGTQSATVNTPVTMTLVPGQYFDRNEAICINRTTVGNAANACFILAQFESID